MTEMTARDRFIKSMREASTETVREQLACSKRAVTVYGHNLINVHAEDEVNICLAELGRRAALKSIDPLNPAILQAYKGLLHGEDSQGIVDIEFPSMHHAASWAVTCEIEPYVICRADRRFFNLDTTVQFYAAEWRRLNATS